MIRTLRFATKLFVTFIVFGAITFFGVVPPPASAQVETFTPVTREMLLDPSPNDWLMYSRTYDSHRFSPLDQINRQNAGRLRMVWVRGMSPGIHEHIPLVYRGVMYVANPDAVIQALDATNGDLIWEYRRKLPGDLGILLTILESPGLWPSTRTLFSTLRQMVSCWPGCPHG